MVPFPFTLPEPQRGFPLIFLGEPAGAAGEGHPMTKSPCNWWLLVPIQCQHKSPMWGAVRSKFYSVQNSQLWYSTAVELCSLLACCALWWLASWLHSRETSLVFQFGKGNRLHSSMERERRPSKPVGSWLIWTEVPTSGPWLVRAHTNEDSKSS